jgi:hypothetical protein
MSRVPGVFAPVTSERLGASSLRGVPLSSNQSPAQGHDDDEAVASNTRGAAPPNHGEVGLVTRNGRYSGRTRVTKSATPPGRAAGATAQ